MSTCFAKTAVSSLGAIDSRKVTTFNSCFMECAQLSAFPTTWSFDGVTAADGFRNMFRGATKLVAFPAHAFDTVPVQASMNLDAIFGLAGGCTNLDIASKSNITASWLVMKGRGIAQSSNSVLMCGGAAIAGTQPETDFTALQASPNAWQGSIQ